MSSKGVEDGFDNLRYQNFNDLVKNIFKKITRSNRVNRVSRRIFKELLNIDITPFTPLLFVTELLHSSIQSNSFFLRNGFAVKLISYLYYQLVFTRLNLADIDGKKFHREFIIPFTVYLRADRGFSAAAE